MSHAPTLRQLHMIKSSCQSSLLLQKGSSKNLVNVTVTTNGTTDSSVDTTQNQKFCKNQDLLFNVSKDEMSHVVLPTIATETCQDESSDKLVIGLPKCEQGDPSCFSNNAHCQLSMVLSCLTTSACTHCFLTAHKRVRCAVSVCSSSPSVSTPPWGLGENVYTLKGGDKVGGGVSRLVAK